MDKRILAIKGRFPYTAEYAKKYGFNALISTAEIPSKYKSVEDLYKECIEKGVKVEDIIKKPPKDAII